MKPYIILIFALITFGAGNLMAQSSESIQKTEQSIRKKGKYALLVMKAQHLKQAIKTGIEFKTTSNKIDFQIITCGELVKEISLDKELQSVLKNAVMQHGLKILICGLSIEQFNVDKHLLPNETPVTKNGLIYMFGLQENGFKTIIL
jgi:intracellular sulfur oxidation DsrE/DsrF family protein